MAKKNSTKTATKEALQASEPRLQAFRGWHGINFSEVSPKWNDYLQETVTEGNQTDLAPNYLLVQNNMKTTEQASIETALKPQLFLEGPALHGSSYTDALGHTLSVNKLTGVSTMNGDYGYFAADTTTGCAIFQVNRSIVDYSSSQSFNFMGFDSDNNKSMQNLAVTDMHVYLNRFIAMCEKTETVDDLEVKHGCIYVSDSDNEHKFITPLYSGYELQPQVLAEHAPTIQIHGDIHGSSDPNDPVLIPEGSETALWSSQCTFFYCMTNQFGSTQPSNYNYGEGYTTYYFDIGPSQWTTKDYITISGPVSDANVAAATADGVVRPISVDIYMIMNESSYPIFVGHANAYPTTVGGTVQYQWTYDFYGAMTDISEWSFANLEPPQDNTTGGVPCRYVNEIDGRLYFWGDPEFPYRLYIGGNAGNELSIAVGVGGAFIDIEPGAGTEIKMVEKFKTYGGSSIVTILCSNVNGSRQHRYNLIETNITATSELAIAGYMVEEIANVVGTTSRHGGGAWSDGLYYINRTGLLVTTQAMEYNSQLRSMVVSSSISPVFEEQRGTDIANSYLVCINDVIYMATCADVDYTDIDQNISKYNSFIWCYDIGLKAWYTIQPTIETEQTINGEQQLVPTTLIPNGLFFYDHEDSIYYGLGVIDPQYGAYISPIYNNQETVDGTFDLMQPIHFETPELGTSRPNTQWQWLCQLEFNFDYFAGDIEIEINGVDYYGRRMHIVKKVSTPTYEDTQKRVTLTALNVPIRIDTLVRYYHITINGRAIFRMNNIVARTYGQSKKIGLAYGFDADHYYMDRFNSAKNHYMHDAVSIYNNLDKLAYEYRQDGLDRETANVT